MIERPEIHLDYKSCSFISKEACSKILISVRVGRRKSTAALEFNWKLGGSVLLWKYK